MRRARASSRSGTARRGDAAGAASQTATAPNTARPRASAHFPRRCARRSPARAAHNRRATARLSPRSSARCSRSSFAISFGSSSLAHTCPCGCGFEQPMMSPLFSKTCTQRHSRPSSAVCSAHVSITRRMSGTAIRASVRSCRGEKQITRHVPRTACAVKSASFGGRSVSAFREQRREVVREHERRVVVGIALAIRTHIPRAEVTLRIVRRPLPAGLRLPPPLPRPLRAMRRDQNPLAGQRIAPPMR